MVTILENIREEILNSSGGNQIKWFNAQNNRWYKMDANGYEGLAEVMSSQFIRNTNCESFVTYKEEVFLYHNKDRNGCSSKNFLPQDAELMTAAKLFKLAYGKSPNEICNDTSHEGKILKFIELLSKLTGLSVAEVGQYLTMMFEIDAVILNKDRHFNNIAFIRKDNIFYPAPLFDHGDSLLSTDYTAGDLETRISKVISKPFLLSFDEQIEIVENNFGKQLIMYPYEIQLPNTFYPDEIYQEMKAVLEIQREKYKYLSHKMDYQK